MGLAGVPSSPSLPSCIFLGRYFSGLQTLGEEIVAGDSVCFSVHHDIDGVVWSM